MKAIPLPCTNNMLLVHKPAPVGEATPAANSFFLLRVQNQRSHYLKEQYSKRLRPGIEKFTSDDFKVNIAEHYGAEAMAALNQALATLDWNAFGPHFANFIISGDLKAKIAATYRVDAEVALKRALAKLVVPKMAMRARISHLPVNAPEMLKAPCPPLNIDQFINLIGAENPEFMRFYYDELYYPGASPWQPIEGSSPIKAARVVRPSEAPSGDGEDGGEESGSGDEDGVAGKLTV
jgi:hypothetical protein